jgi:uncharacterized protein
MAGSLYLLSWRIAPCEVLAGFDTRHDTPPFKSRHHPNSRIALTWYRLAAEQGVADAQYNLGNNYRNGEGVPQDYAEAVKWYRLSAEPGGADAQNNLGAAYELGNGALQSNVMAHMWYNIASANGHPRSGEWRDERAGLMSQADISKAQQMARECMSSNYQNCD